MTKNERRAFTGIVVRTGTSVVLDNGSEALSLKPIDGDCTLKLGSKVTANRVAEESRWEVGDDTMFREVEQEKPEN